MTLKEAPVGLKVFLLKIREIQQKRDKNRTPLRWRGVIN